MEIRLDILEAGCFYHIFNRGINGTTTFLSEDNYRYFLTKVKQHIVPFADIYAYCIMPNHFHFIIKLKSPDEILNASISIKKSYFIEKGLHSENKIVSKQIGKLMSGYTQAF